ncbi:hypothetical protein D3C81_1803660 [compost metagenome]
MDGVGLRQGCDAHQIGKVQIAVLGQGRTDAIGFVRQPDMEGISVGFRINGDRIDIHLLAGADDPDRNLAPVGN